MSGAHSREVERTPTKHLHVSLVGSTIGFGGHLGLVGALHMVEIYVMHLPAEDTESLAFNSATGDAYLSFQYLVLTLPKIYTQ